MWDLPGPGIEPVSSALAGRLLPTELPGKYAVDHFTRSGQWGWCSVVRTPKGCAPPEIPLMETEHPYDPAVPPADIYPKETKTLTQIEMCTPMFIAALFTTNQDVEIT